MIYTITDYASLTLCAAAATRALHGATGQMPADAHHLLHLDNDLDLAVMALVRECWSRPRIVVAIELGIATVLERQPLLQRAREQRAMPIAQEAADAATQGQLTVHGEMIPLPSTASLEERIVDWKLTPEEWRKSHQRAPDA